MSETHDYSGNNRYWGHDYTFEPHKGGRRGRAMGWGHGIRKGDYLILDNGPGETTRYRVMNIGYFPDPPDMWKAELKFAPREEK